MKIHPIPRRQSTHKNKQRNGTDDRISEQGYLTGIINTLGFPGGSEVKASACNAGDLGLIPEWGRSPGKGNEYPLQYGEFYGQRSLAGYSPEDQKESETAERLSLSLY